ncbi:hypothetical protein ACIBCT_28360 [Streptosporangium sp. NPDC050855]|uniref:hypothetical protein n=1 Tax=Streptosporangium sp. NPDC050855 TaxID=3366194 RepID=UPI0037AEB57A
MRALSSMLVLAAAGAAILTGTPAHADDVNLAARVQPGEEVFLTPELVPAAQYNGNVLIKLDNNSVPVKIKIGNCRGRYIGTLPIAANDHAAYVAASTTPPAQCIRYRVKNMGNTPAAITGTGYF